MEVTLEKSEPVRADRRKYTGISARRLARNSIINFSGQAAVAVAALAFLPVTVRNLGPDRYGLIAIAFVLLGSFTLLDLGLGRATTNFVASAAAEGRFDDIPPLVWTSSLLQAAIGVVLAALLFGCASPLVSTLHIAKTLLPEARVMVCVLAFCAPFALASSSLRGALEGVQCFGAVNLVKCSINICTYALPALASTLGYGVPAIMLMLLSIRMAGAAAFAACCLFLLPGSQWKPQLLRTPRLWKLFSYSGWVAVSNCIVPFLVQIDRYLIGAIVSVAAVTYYAVPFEMMNGLWIIPASIAAVLFPGFSSLRESDQRMVELFVRSTRYILLLLGTATTIVAVFAFDILRIWQGPSIASASFKVLIVLSIGVLINSVGWVPANFLMGRGRPDLPAKIHMIQAPLYLGLACLLITWFGILGAAVAFTLRVSFEAALLFQQASKLCPHAVRLAFKRSLPSAISLAGLAAILVALRHLPFGPAAAAGGTAGAVAVFATWAWFFLLDARDRKVALSRMHRAPHRSTLPARMRVLHVGADDAPGGVARYIASMIPEWAARGVDCHVTVFEKRTARPSDVFPAACTRHELNLLYRPWSIARSARDLRRILKEAQIEVLHLHTARAGLLGVLAAFGTGIPVVYTGHGLRFDQKEAPLARAIFRFYEKLICSLADRSTMLTERDRRLAIRCRVVAPEKSVVIGTRILWNEAMDTALDDKLQRNGFVVGSVGQLCERKDPSTFLRTAKLVSDVRPDVSFVWIGDGELRPQVEKMAHDLGITDRLTLTGNISGPEVSRWLRKMSVFVFPSRSEGVPLAILEAFAMGTPVVSSRYRGSGWYYIVKNEQTALTFRPGDADACASHILRVARDGKLRERIAVAGCMHFAAQYRGTDIMAREFFGIYSNLLHLSEGRRI